MAGHPVISVVIPTYRDGERLLQAIDSVVAQEFQDWEAIILDDGSPHDSQEMVAGAVAALRDDRLRYVRGGRNRGVARARNLGIRLSRGQFIAFLDADDLWLPKKLGLQLAEMQRHGRQLSCTGYKNTAQDRTHVSVRTPPAQIGYADLLNQNTIGCSTVMMNAARFGKSYFPDIPMRQDFAHWLKVLRNGDVALGLPEILTERRVFDGSLSSNKLRAARHTWQVYRDIEGLSLWKSVGHFTTYAFNGILSR
jgi:teichuronic acid biosynthesis glycosyltransferase TuaG